MKGVNMAKYMQIEDKRLLPCPFCGGDASITYFPAMERLENKDKFYVGCDNTHCGCEMEHAGGWKSIDEAVNAWNTRNMRNCDICLHKKTNPKTGYKMCELWECKFEAIRPKIGHWIGTEYDGYSDGEPVYEEWQCSNCGVEFRAEEMDFEYCPRCGAKMEVGESGD